MLKSKPQVLTSSTVDHSHPKSHKYLSSTADLLTSKLCKYFIPMAKFTSIQSSNPSSVLL